MGRIDKLNAELQREIYDILKNKTNDPRLSEMFSVMSVECDRELKHAKVFISIFSGDAQKKEDTFAAIKSSAGFVRRELSRNMKIRTVPELHFHIDDSQEHSAQINKILAEINKQEK